MSAAMSASATYLVAATTVTFGPTSSWTRASRSRITSGDGTDHSLDAASAPVAPVREEQLRVVTRAEVDALDARDAGCTKRTLGGAPEIELPVHRQVVVEQSGPLRPDLVTARADRRPNHRRQRAAAKRVHTRGNYPLRKPAPTRMEDRNRPRAFGPRDRDRQAVGGHGEQRDARLVGPQAVPRLTPGARAGAVDRR